MPVHEPYGTYDIFAWFYNEGWGSDFHEQAARVFDRHIFPKLPAGARILDVCCGTGDLSAILATRGYKVTGIDGSEEMLRYARKRAPGAEFLQADARHFSIGGSRFDAAVSTYDSLNHILEPEELECAFESIAAALAPGGILVFDLNTEGSFKNSWQGSYGIVNDTAAGITRASYDSEAKIGRVDLTMFRLVEGVWQRSDVSVLERCYEVEDVTASLGRAGFVQVEARRAWELEMQGYMAVGRVFFFAVKA